MSLPVIAAGRYALPELSFLPSLWPAMAWGAASLMMTTWVVVWAKVRVVARLEMSPLVMYTVALGCAVLILAVTCWR